MAAGYRRDGFRAVKLKVGFGIAEDVRTTRAVRRAIGVETALMVDANHAYDVVAAIELGRRIEELDIGWFEEPVPPEDVAGHRAVRAALKIPIASGECEFTRFVLLELLSTRAVDIVQPGAPAPPGASRDAHRAQARRRRGPGRARSRNRDRSGGAATCHCASMSSREHAASVGTRSSGRRPRLS